MTAAFVRSFNGWAFDCTVSENHESDATITTHPLDTGASLGDHMFVNPRTLTVVGIVSNTPLYLLTADPFSASPNARRVNALAMLERLQDDGVLFDVQTGLKLYQNMALKNIQTPDDKKNAGWGKFTLKLQQVTVSSTQIATYAPAPGLASQIPPTSANGTQQATNVTSNAQTAPQGSLAAQLNDSVPGWKGGVFGL
jgi:hypothetical protein